jgi:hypothetical protein
MRSNGQAFKARKAGTVFEATVVLLIHVAEVLSDERYQAFHAVLIRSVLVGEFVEHEFFFVAQFDANAHEYQRHRDDSGYVPEHDHGCDEHGQQPV